jgi:hypothetical protein
MGWQGERKKHYRTIAQQITTIASQIVLERLGESEVQQEVPTEELPPTNWKAMASSFESVIGKTKADRLDWLKKKQNSAAGG